MEKIKHLIITRFYCNNQMSLGDNIFKKDILDRGIEFLKTYLIPSLECQSNKNFEWIILVHENTKDEYLKDLYDLKTSFQKTIIKVVNNNFRPLREYTRKYYQEYDWVISSRIDHDDQFYYKAVEEIQSSIKSVNKPIYVYSFNKCVMHNIIDNTYKKTNNPFKKKGGGRSVMLTLVVNTKKITKQLDIHSLGNHTKVCNWLKENHKSIGLETLDYDPLISNNQEDTILYTIHQTNDSNKLQSWTNMETYTNFDYNKFFNKKVKKGNL